ncbi:50S ribosomal protein L4 [Candidatus Uhrbacteria bacterium]|jgi:large subunit ribosomal protein L4|nr:50S ribosomal protein L4 [Candidatus Uhrbacteria bacterium]
MAKVTLYNQLGETTGDLKLDALLFDVKASPALVHEAVVAQTANARSAIAHTKTRGEVRGGGRKPWKQKGTGRARHGSRRSPIWIGGGITFGPRSIRNFAKKMNRKARRKALAMVLSDKVAHEKIVALEGLTFDGANTRALSAVLAKLPSSGKKTLLVTVPENKVVAKSAKNLSGVETLPANALNIVDLLRYEYVVVTKSAIDLITKLYNRA